jgi:hypothetical protein
VGDGEPDGVGAGVAVDEPVLVGLLVSVGTALELELELGLALELGLGPGAEEELEGVGVELEQVGDGLGLGSLLGVEPEPAVLLGVDGSEGAAEVGSLDGVGSGAGTAAHGVSLGAGVVVPGGVVPGGVVPGGVAPGGVVASIGTVGAAGPGGSFGGIGNGTTGSTGVGSTRISPAYSFMRASTRATYASEWL